MEKRGVPLTGRTESGMVMKVISDTDYGRGRILRKVLSLMLRVEEIIEIGDSTVIMGKCKAFEIGTKHWLLGIKNYLQFILEAV